MENEIEELKQMIQCWEDVAKTLYEALKSSEPHSDSQGWKKRAAIVYYKSQLDLKNHRNGK